MKLLMRVLRKFNEPVDGNPIMVLICIFGGLAVGGLLARLIALIPHH